jgi:DNA-binding protein YbaB
MVDRPDWNALYGAFDDLRRAVGGLEDKHRKIMKITGVGWSDDRMVKAVVGPRGQLVDIEIDPRVYRKPNSKALSAAILAAVRVAIADANSQTMATLDRDVPADLRIKKVGSLDVRRLMETPDSDLAREDGE